MTGEPQNILIVRLGAMGDIIHALPAAAALRRRWRSAHITWAVEAKWAPLLEGNGLQDRLLLFQRHNPKSWLQTRAELRTRHYDLAIDFQGLIKSALLACAAKPAELIGYQNPRERPAAWLYTRRVEPKSPHVVNQALELIDAPNEPITFPLPPGHNEAPLPAEPFVLACPFAGWTSKQWPLAHYEALARLLREKLNLPLVFNGAPGTLPNVPWAQNHESGISGLIHATRRASLVIGVDSGPLHLAAALNKSGAAIFGPTDPARNGPVGGDFHVFRSPRAFTTHGRGTVIDPAMQAIQPEAVFEVLAARLNRQAP